MEKILHERMREWAQKEKDGVPTLHEWLHYFGGSLDSPPKDADIWESLADEIERYYVPKHFDEKGELWNEHDEADLEGETVIIQGFSENGMFYEKSDMTGFFWGSIELFKRPIQDSLEKLRDDIDCYMRDCALDTDTIDEFERRFTALIERGA